jgi:hypothetical protein
MVYGAHRVQAAVAVEDQLQLRVSCTGMQPRLTGASSHKYKSVVCCSCCVELLTMTV